MHKQFTVSVIVLRCLGPQSEVLMIHHKKFNRWMIPGGHIESNENPNQAAIREVYEETGISIKLISFLHKHLPVSDGNWLYPAEYFYEQLIPESQTEQAHYHLDSTFVALANDDFLRINEIETNGVRWIPVSEIPFLYTFEGTKKTILDVQSKIEKNRVYENKNFTC